PPWRMGLGQPLGVGERPAGGPGTGARRGVVLAEEMSYWDRGMSVAMPGLGLGGPPLLSMGTPEQKERFLAPFRDRERPHWAAFGMTEPGAGSDVAAIQTTAVRAGDDWVLNGAKTFISNSMRADWIVVWATVDRGAGRGVRRGPRLRAHPLCARPPHPALPARARQARAHGAEDRGGPSPLLARRVPGRSGAAERDRSLDGEGVRGGHGAGGDGPRGRDPGRRGRRPRRLRPEALPPRAGEGPR